MDFRLLIVRRMPNVDDLAFPLALCFLFMNNILRAVLAEASHLLLSARLFSIGARAVTQTAD